MTYDAFFYITVDGDASPEVLITMEVAANIHEDDTITPDGGKLMVGQGYPPTEPPYQAPMRCGLDLVSIISLLP